MLQPGMAAALALRFFASPSPCAEPLLVQFGGDLYVREDLSDRSGAIFERLKGIFSQADAVIPNLEGALTTAGPRAWDDTPFALRMSPGLAPALRKFGMKWFVRANNHAMDFGERGRSETDAALRKAGIAWTGAGKDLDTARKPLWIEKAGVKLGILSRTTTYPFEAWATPERAGVAPADFPSMKADLAELRGSDAFAIVALHWGEELSLEPRPLHREMARALREGGADLVIGHHPHILQRVERIGAPLSPFNVFYSLGNLAFTSHREVPRWGGLVVAEFCAVPRSLRTALIPLRTTDVDDGYASRPTTLPELPLEAAPYLMQGLLPTDLPIHLVSEGRTRTLGDWLVEAQARK